MSAEELIAEFEDIYLSDPDFGEDVVYNVNGITPKPIKAVIYRKGHIQRRQPGDRGAQSMQSQYDFEIEISRGATNGIADVIEKVETVNAPLNHGDATLSLFRVSAIIRQDAAVWHLGLLK